MKRHKVFLLCLVFLIGIVGSGYSLTTANITLRVTISGTLSVDLVGTSEYQIGAVAAGATSAAQSAITVRNNSTDMIESFKLHCHATSVPSAWTLANAVAGNTFELLAVFSTTKPADADADTSYNESGNQDNLTNTAAYCDASVYACAGGVENGASVETSGTRSLWFRFKAPSSISVGSGTEQTIPVTVTAANTQ